MSGGETSVGRGRLEGFSDGVMAVIITIMAFQLKTPVTADFHGLGGQVPSLAVYVLSFAMIGIYWNNHHHLLAEARGVTALVMWTNLVLLFWLSLVPFATNWVGAAYNHAAPAATYGVVALASAIAYFALERAIVAANSSERATFAFERGDFKGFASPVMYAFGIGLAFASPYLAYACYTAVSVMWFVPTRRVVKQR